MDYFVVPGRMNQLCVAEIDALISHYSVTKKFSSSEILYYSSEKEIPLIEVCDRSGGIYKAGILDLQLESKVEKNDILSAIATYIKNYLNGESRIAFGVSIYGNSSFARNFSSVDLRSIKDVLSDNGFNSAYIESDHADLSSVQVRKKGLIGKKGVEVVLSFTEDGISIGHTVAVQDFDTWSAVDYNRPGVDPKSGMLPPKVARMILNLGIELYGKGSDITVLDPFCGSGTILSEALRLGCRVIGSDNSQKAVDDSTKNIEWLLRQPYYAGSVTSMEEIKLILSESAHIDSLLNSNSVDLIVTEPYMGPNFTAKPTPGKLERVIKGLEKLYIGSFKSFNNVLRNGGVLVFAEPQFFMAEKTYKIGIIDNPERFGYTLGSKILEYNREKAFVGRRIALLVKK